MQKPARAHAPGSTVVIRTVTAGRIRWASVAVAVRDDAEVVAYFQPNIAANKVTAAAAARWTDREARELALRQELLRGDFELVDHVPARRVPTLTVAHHDDWFSVRFAFREGWRPEYVNVCLPYRRSAVGFDTDDLCLDLVVEDNQDGSLRYKNKDDDDLDGRAALGIYTESQVAAIRAAGESAAQRLTVRAAPFDGGWRNWEPDPHWSLPLRLPARWADDVAGSETASESQPHAETDRLWPQEPSRSGTRHRVDGGTKHTSTSH